MFQVGCVDRLLERDVAHLIDAALAERPAAAGQRDLLDALDPLEIEALPDRVVLAVDRQQRRAVRRDFLHEEAAGADQYLLVGEGDDARRAAPRPGSARVPAAPTIPAITQSAGRSAASTSASAPHAAAMPEPDSASFSAPYSAGSAIAANRAFELPRLLGQQRRVAVGGQRLDGEFVAVAQQQIDRALADRPGRAEDRDAARPGRRRRRARLSAVTAMSARFRRRKGSATPRPGSPPADRRAGQAGHRVRG